MLSRNTIVPLLSCLSMSLGVSFCCRPLFLRPRPGVSAAAAARRCSRARKAYGVVGASFRAGTGRGGLFKARERDEGFGRWGQSSSTDPDRVPVSCCFAVEGVCSTPESCLSCVSRCRVSISTSMVDPCEFCTTDILDILLHLRWVVGEG
jgi:hypothetical protein